MNIWRAASTVLLVASIAGCGDDDGNNNNTPDAFIIHDVGIDARACGTATGGMLDFGQFDEQGFISWVGPLTGTIGGGMEMVYQFEFYGGIEPSLAGTFDLKAGNQGNYSTCAICVRAFVFHVEHITLDDQIHWYYSVLHPHDNN